MPPDEELRTAKTILSRRISNRPTVISRRGPVQQPYHKSIQMQPPRRPLPRPPNARSRRSSQRESCGREMEGVKTACLQHGWPTDLAQRIREWEHECPPQVNNYPFADEERPWRVSSPKWTPARLPGWPEDSSILTSGLSSRSISPPLECQVPLLQDNSSRLSRQRQWLEDPKEDTFEESLLRGVRELRSSILARTSTDQGVTHRESETSFYQREGFGQSINRETKEEQRCCKEKRENFEDKQRQAAHQNQVPTSAQEPVKSKQRFQFNQDFNFGPKTRYIEDDDYPTPLSPRSSYMSLPELSLNNQSNSLKRQRHDSSTTDAVPRSAHDQLYLKGINMFEERPRSTPPIPAYIQQEFGTEDVHPGQRVDFTRPNFLRRVGSSGDDEPWPTAYLNHSYIANRVNPRASFDPRWEDLGFQTPRRKRSSYRRANMGAYLSDWPGKGSKLKVVDIAALEALEDRVQAQYWNLQRMSHTTRPHSPFLSASGHPAATSAFSTRASHRNWARKGSYVARCESTDAFMRFVREKAEARMRAQREREGRGRRRVDTLYPGWTGDGDWVGDGPL